MSRVFSFSGVSSPRVTPLSTRRTFGPFALVMALSALAGCHAMSAAAVPAAGPMCTVSHGLPNIVLSFDGGDTFVYGDAPVEWGPHDPERHNWQDWSAPVVSSVVALDAPGMLVALSREQLFSSTDYGCHWQPRGAAGVTGLGEVEGGFASVSRRATNGDSAGPEALSLLTADGLESLPALPESPMAIIAKPGHPRHLRLVGGSGKVFELSDRGSRWTQVGDFGAPVKRATSDPSDWEHLVVLTYDGPSVSRDGGRTWARSRGYLPLPEGWSSGFVSFARGDVVWLGSGRQVYRSTDGGVSFAPVPPRPGPERYLYIRKLRGHVDESVLTFLEQETLARFDARSTTWTFSPRVEPKARPEETAATLGIGTFVAGRPGTMCLTAILESDSGPIGERERVPSARRRDLVSSRTAFSDGEQARSVTP